MRALLPFLILSLPFLGLLWFVRRASSRMEAQVDDLLSRLRVNLGSMHGKVERLEERLAGLREEVVEGQLVDLREEVRRIQALPQIREALQPRLAGPGGSDLDEMMPLTEEVVAKARRLSTGKRLGLNPYKQIMKLTS